MCTGSPISGLASTYGQSEQLVSLNCGIYKKVRLSMIVSGCLERLGNNTQLSRFTTLWTACV